MGKEPITDKAPAGSDVRYEPEYEALQAEIDKLSSPTASSGVDWDNVAKLSAKILAGKKKIVGAVKLLQKAIQDARSQEVQRWVV